MEAMRIFVAVVILKAGIVSIMNVYVVAKYLRVKHVCQSDQLGNQ